MGCAASTTTAQPGYPAASTNTVVVQQRQQQQRSSPPLPVAQVQQLSSRLQRDAALDSVRAAPIVKSLVSLQREKCSIERDQQGYHLRFHISALAPGEAKAFFLATGADVGSSFEVPRAEQVGSHPFEPGRSLSCRLFLCQDLKRSLEGFGDEREGHQLVLDLRADSGAAGCITAQRSVLKFLEGDALQVTRQLVQCGSVVRSLDALYGNLPNPRGRTKEAGEAGEAEGGDCVICLSKPREVVILHCRHVCLCASCAQITSSTWSHQCPVCRGRVAAMVGLDAAASRG